MTQQKWDRYYGENSQSSKTGQLPTVKELADGLEQAARARGKGVESDVTANIAWAIRKGDRARVQRLLDKHIDDIIGGKSAVNQIMQWLKGNDPEMDQRKKQERQAVSVRYPRNPFVYKSRFTPIVYTIGFKTATKKTNEPLWWTGSGFKDLGIVRANPEEFATESEAKAKIKTEILEFIRRWREDDSHLIVGWDEQATEDMTMRGLTRRKEMRMDIDAEHELSERGSKEHPSIGMKLKDKYMTGGHFKGAEGTGERFKNCTAYMQAKGGVDDPAAVCAKIARSKGVVGKRKPQGQALAADVAVNPADSMLEVFTGLAAMESASGNLQEATVKLSAQDRSDLQGIGEDYADAHGAEVQRLVDGLAIRVAQHLRGLFGDRGIMPSKSDRQAYVAEAMAEAFQGMLASVPPSKILRDL